MANQKRLSNAELATFFGQMAMLLYGGIYYREGIETMLNDTKSPSARAMLEQIIAELNESKYTWVDQDVGNYRCQGAIFDMPSEYNSNYWTDKNAPGARIVHFAGMKRQQWVNKPEVVKFRDMPWDTALWMHSRNAR